MASQPVESVQHDPILDSLPGSHPRAPNPAGLWLLQQDSVKYVRPDGSTETKLDRGFDMGWTTRTDDVVLYDASDGFFILDGGREFRPVASVPKVTCGGDELEVVVFYASEIRPAECDRCVSVTFTDGPPLSETEVNVLLDLGVGAASVGDSLLPRGCVVELDGAVPEPTVGRCNPPPDPTPEPLEGEMADILRDFALHSVSPDRRWHVYVGNELQHDAWHYQAVVLDSQSLDLYGLEETAPSPTPLAAPTAVTMSRAYYPGIDLMDPDGQLVWLDDATLLVNGSPWGSQASYVFEIGRRVTRFEGHVAIPVAPCADR